VPRHRGRAVQINSQTTDMNRKSILPSALSALFKKPTKFFEDPINKGRTAMTAMHKNFTPLQEGIRP